MYPFLMCKGINYSSDKLQYIVAAPKACSNDKENTLWSLRQWNLHLIFKRYGIVLWNTVSYPLWIVNGRIRAAKLFWLTALHKDANSYTNPDQIQNTMGNSSNRVKYTMLFCLKKINEQCISLGSVPDARPSWSRDRRWMRSGTGKR